ncbi:membrane protein [Bradyrhizobium sp. Ce-3]|nr:membrane protein [Bradyrhizobium sp. Ce-3]
MNDMSWTPLGPPQPPPQPVPPPMPVAFSGSRKEFFRLVARGAGLELVTVGFYRFWLTTDIRRHLWSNTQIDGDAPEYTGRGKELLIGFLIALAILVPIYLGYFLIGIEAEHLKAFASLPLVAFFYLFGQFAIYRARRYRLTRTVWRGVRFWMSGSGWIYALKASLWGVLVVITLGFALPWREAALERYKMRHSYYGDLQGSFEGRGWEFFKRGWWLWLLMPFALYSTIFAPFAYAAFKAVEWRWWLSGIRFGEVRLESTLPRSALIGLYWKVIGWVVLLGLVFAAYLVLCTLLVASMDGSSIENFFRTEAFAKSIPLIVLLGIGYLAFALALNVVMRVYLMRDLWVRVLSSTIVHNIGAAADVTARGDLANALGEGFADGLDVGGF